MIADLIQQFNRYANNPLPIALGLGVVLLAITALASRRMGWWQRVGLFTTAVIGAVAWWMM